MFTNAYKKNLLWGMTFFLVVALIIFCSGCAKKALPIADTAENKTGYTVVDALGTVVKINKKPERILTLGQSTDSIVLGMVKTNKLLAINALAEDPVSSNITEKARKISSKLESPNLEKLLALKPDLIIANSWTSPNIVTALRELGFSVVVTPPVKNVTDIEDTIKLISTTISEEKKGQLMIAKMQEELRKIKIEIDEIPLSERKKIVLISLMTNYGGSGSLFDEMCTHAGVTNGMSSVGIKNGQTLTKEMLVEINPDILFLPSYRNHGKYDVQSFNDTYINDTSLQTINAIQNKQLLYPREGYIYNSSQDFVYGVKEIAYTVYGEKFAQPADRHISFSGEY